MTGDRRHPAGLPGPTAIPVDPAVRALAARASGATVAAVAVRAALVVLLTIVELAAAAGIALAVDPSASPATGGDVRTDPAAPGLVGDPLFALLGVAAIAAIAVVATLVAIRLADRR